MGKGPLNKSLKEQLQTSEVVQEHAGDGHFFYVTATNKGVFCNVFDKKILNGEVQFKCLRFFLN